MTATETDYIYESDDRADLITGFDIGLAALSLPGVIDVDHMHTPECPDDGVIRRRDGERLILTVETEATEDDAWRAHGVSIGAQSADDDDPVEYDGMGLTPSVGILPVIDRIAAWANEEA